MVPSNTLKDKVVLITGMGSLGKALLPEVLKQNPSSVRVFDHSEYALWEIRNEPVRMFIGDVRDRDRLHRALSGVDIVIHTAALKHVPFCEYNPIEAVKTNIMGMVNIIDEAIDNKVDRVLAISSDKAVQPVNLYGASKLVMEKLAIQANVYGNTKFSCIRSGNFEGSDGSLVEIIKDALRNGKKVGLTDERMKRFWIPFTTISKFIIECIGMMEGGEIFIPKMTEQLVVDIMKSWEVEYEITGIRHGEKLQEILFAEGENPIDKGEYYLIK